MRVDVTLEGFQLELLLRAGLGRAQPRVRVLGGEHHGVTADLGVELHFDEPADVGIAPQAADPPVLRVYLSIPTYGRLLAESTCTQSY